MKHPILYLSRHHTVYTTGKENSFMFRYVMHLLILWFFCFIAGIMNTDLAGIFDLLCHIDSHFHFMLVLNSSLKFLH